MDELRAFFNNPCPSRSQVTKLRGPLTGGFRITKEDPTNLLNRREEHRHSMVLSGTDYAREIKERETNVYIKNETERDKWESISGGLESMEQLSSFGASTQNIGDLTDEAMNEVYNKYSFQMKEDTNNLAINEYKQQILDRIHGFPVVIVEGPTGCGKTTQVPQWILDDCYQKRKPCKIVVTQPRRIAAISIAKRVAQERGWDVGGLVGYQVGLDNTTTSDTRIHYVTTGVLLQKLVASKTMNEYTHVILDEVHERGQEMDFLLLVVKRLLYTVSPLVKVVLMSATFNRKAFADYFLIPTTRGLSMSSCIKVDKKKPMFTVKTFYLNNLNKFGSILHKCTQKEGDPTIVPEMYHLVIKLVDAFETIDKGEDHYSDRSEADLPSVLIFLPGINEIEELYNCLMDKSLRVRITDNPECANYNWQVLPLHSTITADEQVRVFHRAPPGARKIILATNIAESSITVPDVKYVIDFCLMKILVADEQTNFTSLKLMWASKTNCEQRSGRAGRVRDGRVYRLVTDKFYDSLQQECDPEIMRCPLERLVLLAKTLDMGPPSDVLALAMDPPDISNIHRNILVLKEMGAMKTTIDGEWCPSDGDLTYLGRVMAKLPIDVRLSKLIMLGYIYGCLDECAIMAAAMSVKNLFNSPFRERLNAYNSKLTWADGSTSDCIAFLNVYKVWNHLRQQQHFKQQGNNEAQWARRFYVQVRALRDLDDLVRELRHRLSREGIEPFKGRSPWDKHELSLVLKIVIAGAMYPQYFVQVSQDEAREREAVRTLDGHDPRNTVYLKNFPDNQPGEVYATAIRNLVRQQIGDEPRVQFDKNSRKVFLIFSDGQQNKRDKNNSGDPTIPGQVVLPVYKAVKARQLKIDLRIPLLPVEKAQELASLLAVDKMELDIANMVPRLPEVDDTHFPLKISYRITVSRFWVQYDDESTASELFDIKRALNSGPLLAYTGPVRPGDIFAGPRTDATGTKILRVRVQRVLLRDMLEVLYIDYGYYGRLNTCNLHVVPESCRDIPPLAMQCVLAETAPSPLRDPRGQWTRAAEACFADLASRGRLLGKVYSVTHGVVSIELLADGGTISVNKELINRGYAVPCEESYDSKMNHDLRQMANELNMAQKRAHNREQAELAFYHMRELEPPNSRECVTDVCLKGPFSPLETVLHNLMYANREKQVNVEWHSVNSVLLDTEPQEVYERLLVAVDVGQNEMNSKFTLRHTTLMPNIPGLPAILALLFCPAAELRRDASGTRYVSTLCGLGSSDTGAPYYPEHDLLINIDADLDVDDIGFINHIRHLMDHMMYCGEGQDMPTADDKTRSDVPRLIRTDLLHLLLKRRKHREPETVPNAWEWKSVPDDELMEINVPDMVARAVVFPLHEPQELRPVTRDQLLQLKRDNDQLKILVSSTCTSSSAELQCKLCGVGPLPVHAMRIHLYSNAHKEKEDDFRMFQS